MRIACLVLIVSQILGSILNNGAQSGHSLSGEKPPRQIWLLSLSGLSLHDIRQGKFPHLKKLVEQGAIGAMNLKTGGNNSEASSYATLGAGTRAMAPEGETFYPPEERLESGETANVRYTQRMGNQAGGATIIYPGVMRYIHENERGNYQVAPGALGETLQRAGRKTAVLGNSDEGDKPTRYAPFFTMNSQGITSRGSIGPETLLHDHARPYGIKTDYRYLLKTMSDWDEPTLIAVELGDLYRLNQMGNEMLPLYREKVKQEILSEVDQFIGQLMTQMTSERMLILLSPVVSPQYVEEKDLLAPIIFYRPGMQRGLLASPTTRRSGIVSNIDIAPTILSQLDLSIPDKMLGRPIQVQEEELSTFWNTVDRTQSVYHLRPLVLYTYVLYQISVLIIGLVLLLRRWEGVSGWMHVVLLPIMLTPFLFLLLSGVTAKSYWLFSTLLMAIAVGMAWTMRRMATIPLLFWIAVISFLPPIIDGLVGGPLIKQSFLGYDPIKGARYYGIGNEYMGVVVGSSILACAAWLEWKRPDPSKARWKVALFFLFLVFFFAAPFLGTNAGGALAGTIGFGVAYFRFFQTRWSKSLIWQGILLFGSGLFILVVLNGFFFADQPSHIGRALMYLKAGDFEEIVHIILRKLDMNLRLIRVSSWGKVFITSLLAMAVMAFRPVKGLNWLLERYPQLFNGFAAIVIAALAALAFNDSGIVSAATAIIYVVVPLLMIGFREWIHKEEGKEVQPVLKAGSLKVKR